jgi:uncharacterized protein (DUF983 family)
MKASRLGAVLKARCPSCFKGAIMDGPFTVRPKCPECGYGFHPEPGYFLGAMMIAFLATAILTVPPMIALKVMKVDVAILVVFPFVEFLFVGTLLAFYSRVIWLHVEHSVTKKLDGSGGSGGKDRRG